jgi:hypothetical protein
MDRDQPHLDSSIDPFHSKVPQTNGKLNADMTIVYLKIPIKTQI